MKQLFKELAVTMIWVFLVLIVGFAILHFFSNRFSGNFLGKTATKVGELATGGEGF